LNSIWRALDRAKPKKKRDYKLSRRREQKPKKKLGVVVSMNYNGTLEARTGVIKPGVKGMAASKPFAFTAPTPWPSVTGHAFDLQHFLHVHDRRLLEPPVIDTPAPYVRRIRYRAEVVPRNFRDRLLSLAGGRVVEAGPPDQLLDRKGHFARVYDLQLGAVSPPVDGRPVRGPRLRCEPRSCPHAVPPIAVPEAVGDANDLDVVRRGRDVSSQTSWRNVDNLLTTGTGRESHHPDRLVRH